MKKMIFFTLILISKTVFCQVDSSIIKQRVKDSTISYLSIALSSSKQNIKSVLDIIDTASSRMGLIARNRMLINSSKTIQLKQIAADRDTAIDKLLNPSQVTKLRKHFSDKRSRLASGAPKGPKLYQVNH